MADNGRNHTSRHVANIVRRGVAVLVACGVVMVMASGCDSPTRRDQATPFTSLDVRAEIDDVGSADVVFNYTMVGDGVAKLRIDQPADGKITSIEVNGDSVSPDPSMTTVDVVGKRATVHMSMRGLVVRTKNAAELRLPIWRQTGQGDQRDALLPLHVTVQLPSALDARPSAHPNASRWLGARDVQEKRGARTVTMSGEFHAERNVTGIVALPSQMFPSVPLSYTYQPGSKREERVYDAVGRQNDKYFAQSDKTQRREDLLAAGYWAFIGLEIAIPLLVAALGAMRFARRRHAVNANAPEILHEPPTAPTPDVAALIVAGGNRLGAQAVAASVLDLISRDVLTMEHITSERFRLRPAVDASVAVSPAERALVDQLTMLNANQSDGWLDSPLPLVRQGAWWNAYRRAVVRAAKHDGYLTRRFPRPLFVFSVIALVITSLPLWRGSPVLAAGALIVAMLLLALSAFGGNRLTDQGLTAQASWQAFGKFAQTSVGLSDAFVPGVVVWGHHLVAAAALGTCEAAIASLSTAKVVKDARGTASITASLMILAAVTFTIFGLRVAQSGAASAPAICPDGVHATFRTQLNGALPRTHKLVGANLRCEDLQNLNFSQLDLTGSDLRGADLRGADFTQADLVDAKLQGVDARVATFGQATMTHVNLQGAKLQGAKFVQAKLVGADMRHAKLQNADFGQAEMGLVDLRDADATGASFGQTNLVRVDGSAATFDRATFTQADIGESDFTGASFVAASLDVVSATASVFTDANLTDAQSIATLRSSGADLEGAVKPTDGGIDIGWLIAGGVVVVVGIVLIAIVARSRSLRA